MSGTGLGFGFVPSGLSGLTGIYLALQSNIISLRTNMWARCFSDVTWCRVTGGRIWRKSSGENFCCSLSWSWSLSISVSVCLWHGYLVSSSETFTDCRKQANSLLRTDTVIETISKIFGKIWTFLPCFHSRPHLRNLRDKNKPGEQIMWLDRTNKTVKLPQVTWTIQSYTDWVNPNCCAVTDSHCVEHTGHH